MPFLCTPRVLNSTDGRVSVQITDLFPNKSQHSAVMTPNFQGPAYLHAHGRKLTETVALDGDFATTTDLSGLAVYFLTTLIDSDGGGVALTAVMANAIANAVIERMESGLSLTKADMNTIIVAKTGGANNNMDLGTASVLEVLQIVSGYKTFSVPTGQDVENGGVQVALDANVQAGFFSTPYDASKLFSKFDSSFFVSARSGQLKIAQLRTDAKGNPTPLVVCYADDGSLIQ